MRDIRDRDDIRELVETFYSRLVIDPSIGKFFAGLDLELHLPRIRAFWEMALLGEPGYTTNVTEVHLRLHQRIPMEQEHFDRWLELFRAAIDERFSGPVAGEAKLRANGIAAVLIAKTRT